MHVTVSSTCTVTGEQPRRSTRGGGVGRLPRWPKPSMWRRARCTGSSGGLSRMGWKGLYGSAPKPTGTESWTTGVRLTWSRWPAAQRRRGMTTGPCACWLARWSSWGWRPPCPTKGCASGSKKRSQAVAEERVVHPQGERGVRGAHGGSAGPIRGTL